MKKLACLSLLALLSIWGVLLASREEEPQGDWQAIQEALTKRRPQTAIQQLDPLFRRALAAEDYDEATKALAMKYMLQSSIEGGKAEERITLLQAEIPRLPAPMHPMLEVVLANWYWDYFQQNQWRFIQRTQTDQPSGDDILTWDLPRILAEIDKHFTAALTADKWLKETPVTAFDELLSKGTIPDTHRPTLFDFVVHDALRFYNSGVQAGATAQDAYVLQACSPVLGSPKEFLSWTIEATDTTSPTLKAIRLYQQLLAFHQSQKNELALADADLQRLEFGYNQSVGEEKSARYKAALAGFVKHWQADPISARAMAAHAQLLVDEQEPLEAHQIATVGWNRFPESVGGQLCYNLLQQIEAKDVNVSAERVWSNPWPSIRVDYRNITQVHFRLVRYQWDRLMGRGDYYPGGLDDELRKELLAATPTRQWSQDLPPTNDYAPASADFAVPDDLQPGFYYLLASADPGFGEQDNRVLGQEIWVSPLSLVTRTGRRSEDVEGLVLDADTGEPLAGATVRSWVRQRVVRESKWVEQRSVQTDAQGRFRIAGTANQSYALKVEHGGHALSSQSPIRSYREYPPTQPFDRTVFFTDRAIYRPGQTIRFKGIALRIDQQNDDYVTREGKSITVVFDDTNGQEIAKQTLRSNSFGSFSGSFTAPRDRLLGAMSIRDEAEPQSRALVRVEEYKRPKFRVEVSPPGDPPRLGANVVVPGTAKAYTGAPIGGAQVKYRVVREVRYPVWWYWRCWWNPPQGEAQEIAHGATITENDGTFQVPFTARPDPSALEKDEPTFRFTIYADVTDTTGETRSAERTVNIAYTALQASLAADDWCRAGQEVTIRIATQSPDGEPRAAQGTVKIYRLRQPDQVHRGQLLPPRFYGPRARAAGQEPEPDLSNPNSWPLGELVQERPFATDATGSATDTVTLVAGAYRALLETTDRYGKPVTALLPLQVVDPAASSLAIKVPHLVAAPQWTVEPGETFLALWGTGYESGRALVEVEHRGQLLQSYWTRPGVTQATVEQNVTEAMRGGFTVHITQVRENRAYLDSHRVEVPWSNKELSIQWEHFTSKLKPGQEETWTATISGPGAEASTAEMVAALYDASLDAFVPHGWQDLDFLRRDRSSVSSQFQNSLVTLYGLLGDFRLDHKHVIVTYRYLPSDIIAAPQFAPRVMRGRAYFGAGAMAPGGAVPETAEAVMADGLLPAAPAGEGAGVKSVAFGEMASASLGQGGGAGPPDPATSPVDLTNVTARTNLNETAFFFPHLVSDSAGKVTLQFTMPEALTQWKFLGLAHDTQLRSGSLLDKVVTSKDLMVEPLAPRFVREGDQLQFTVKVTNQSPTRQTGTVRLTLSDARTLEAVDDQLGNQRTDQAFDIPAGQAESFSWRLQVPDAIGFLTYKAVGSTGRLSDGEEGFLPVLSRRILVTESLPLPIRDAGTKQFEFTKLLQSKDSDTLRHQSLTVQMVSNPAWYAVLALPYLMEYPYECSEQTFNRLYANVLAEHIANSDPKIRRIFDQWRDTPALDSPLEKNEELKAVLLEETPWLRQAQQESQARRNVGILFDANRLRDETGRALRKLAELQAQDGSWPWFPGGRPNDYITLYITTGFGRLRHLGAELDVTAALKSLTRLDTWIDEQYRRILADGRPDENHLTSTIALYLYGRSFFLDDQAIDPQQQAAVDYFLGQARKYWSQLNSRQSEAHLAIALKRFGDRDTPRDIVVSLKERSVSSEEMGMSWRDTERSWWWYRAPIETQAMMIEAFDEVMNDQQAVADCRVWLLKQKQTQDWKTTKATADAVYSLLLRGTDLLASDALVQVTLGDRRIEPEQVEAGTGFYQQRLGRGEIQPQLGQITVTKTDPGVAWGSVHWQYLEDMSKVTPYAGTPLTLRKRLFTKAASPRGPVLTAVDGPVSVGDELVVRLELRVDRDMEYVHLKDQRGSGLEPVNVLSGYQYQDGLAYYESTRDTASHFFIDYLPKGTYVFEYSTRVVHRGQYQSGMAQIQCMYAPEFNSHSASVSIVAQ